MSLSPNPECLRTLLLVDVLLVVKMMLVGLWTSLLRMRRKVYATSEDYALRAEALRSERDPDIERVRRAHQNDLESLLPFFVASACCLFAEPPVFAFRVLVWSFLAARVGYSFFYVNAVQPHRTIAFTLGAVVTGLLVLLTLVGLV